MSRSSENYNVVFGVVGGAGVKLTVEARGRSEAREIASEIEGAPQSAIVSVERARFLTYPGRRHSPLKAVGHSIFKGLPLFQGPHTDDHLIHQWKDDGTNQLVLQCTYEESVTITADYTQVYQVPLMYEGVCKCNRLEICKAHRRVINHFYGDSAERVRIMRLLMVNAKIARLHRESVNEAREQQYEAARLQARLQRLRYEPR